MYLKIWNSIHLTAAVRDYMPNFETIWLHSKGEKGGFFFYEELKKCDLSLTAIINQLFDYVVKKVKETHF